MNPDGFFFRHPLSKKLFAVICQQVEALGETSIRVTKSQIAFRRHRNFAFVWIPGKYLRGRRPPLVLTIGLQRRDMSPRWKQVVEPYPGRFTHHLELNDPAEIDDEVKH
jgi:hypothetical protein